MKLSKLRIENFRSFKEETIYFDDYTCLVGAIGTGKSAAFAKPEYESWWRLWEEGWVSLGRTRNFDWMHVQASKI